MTVRQTLIFHSAGCHTCGATVSARNAQAWASNHVRHNPGHFAEVSLGFAVSDRSAASLVAEALQPQDPTHAK